MQELTHSRQTEAGKPPRPLHSAGSPVGEASAADHQLAAETQRWQQHPVDPGPISPGRRRRRRRRLCCSRCGSPRRPGCQRDRTPPVGPTADTPGRRRLARRASWRDAVEEPLWRGVQPLPRHPILALGLGPAAACCLPTRWVTVDRCLPPASPSLPAPEPKGFGPRASTEY